MLIDDDFEGLQWLDHARCADRDLGAFFVEAGHTISEDVLALCRACPVRRECVSHAYRREIDAGYFGGLSPSQRRQMTLAQALATIKAESRE